MKKIFILPIMALMAVVLLPNESAALSCIDPEGMINHIVSEDDYVVVTASPTKQKEFVKKEVDANDPNLMYPEGLSGQFITVKEAHKGIAPDRQWVYFERNSTWNYLCAGEPPKVGTENVYVINVSTNLFQPQTVVAVYEADSEIAKNLLEQIADAEEVVPPMIETVSTENWKQRLYDELKEMAFIVKVKLAEWEFWRSI